MKKASKIFYTLLAALLINLLLINSVFAAFSDVTPSHENYEAILYLEQQGILEGYADGTFRPENDVARAEAVKIIIAPLYSELETVTENPFPDVTPDLWFAGFVKKAKDEGIVSGDGNTGNFEGARSVNLVEFLKILLLAYNANVSQYENPTEVLFNDVADLSQWFIPYLHFAYATNLIHADNAGNIYPGNALSRGEVAEITYRLILNIQGGDVQIKLSMAEAEMIKILQYIDINDIDNAEKSASFALQYANEAYDMAPEESIVQAAQKIALAFDELVKGYREGLNENYEAVEAHAASAWNLANEAEIIDGSIVTLSSSIKNIAHTMAENARNI